MARGPNLLTDEVGGGRCRVGAGLGGGGGKPPLCISRAQFQLSLGPAKNLERLVYKFYEHYSASLTSMVQLYEFLLISRC